MSKELEYYGKKVARGLMDRRAFMGRATALGVSASMAGTIMAQAASDMGPVKGGTLKAGMQGGESTNSLDPASFLTDVPISFGRTWGDTMVEVSPEGEIQYRIAPRSGASRSVRMWSFTTARP